MMTTREALESLLVDRAANELSPEVEALLQAHLEQDPSAGQQARQLEETLELARQAVAVPRPKTLPEPKFAARRRFDFAFPDWKELLRPVPLTAGLSAGLMLGWWVTSVQWSPADTGAVAHVATRPGPSATASSAQDVSLSASQISRRLLERKESAASRNLYSVAWDSQERKPRIKNNL
jgi:hypothetical protein